MLVHELNTIMPLYLVHLLTNNTVFSECARTYSPAYVIFMRSTGCEVQNYWQRGCLMENTENMIKSTVRNDQKGWKGKKMTSLCDDKMQGKLWSEAIENLYSIPSAILLVSSTAVILLARGNQWVNERIPRINIVPVRPIPRWGDHQWNISAKLLISRSLDLKLHILM